MLTVTAATSRMMDMNTLLLPAAAAVAAAAATLVHPCRLLEG
jgi:hypothetical protein